MGSLAFSVRHIRLCIGKCAPSGNCELSDNSRDAFQEDRESILPKLRVESRRLYLEKRKEDKLVELEQDIQDEEFLFADQKLTDREKRELEKKKKLLEIAKEHEKAKDLERVSR